MSNDEVVAALRYLLEAMRANPDVTTLSLRRTDTAGAAFLTDQHGEHAVGQLPSDVFASMLEELRSMAGLGPLATDGVLHTTHDPAFDSPFDADTERLRASLALEIEGRTDAAAPTQSLRVRFHESGADLVREEPS